jgi:hypothetical protein
VWCGAEWQTFIGCIPASRHICQACGPNVLLQSLLLLLLLLLLPPPPPPPPLWQHWDTAAVSELYTSWASLFSSLYTVQYAWLASSMSAIRALQRSRAAYLR